MHILIYGAGGWIGSQVKKLLDNQQLSYIAASSRADDLEAAQKMLVTHKFTHVMCLIGRTHGEGINTIDYLEQPGKLKENIRDNLMAPVQLAILCQQMNIHFTYLGTGCIFSNPSQPDNECKTMYNEASFPDFFGSSYSVVKGFTDRLMHVMDNTVLNVRIRMPITDTIHPRNFITKIVSYEKVCSIENSMTVLPDLLPIMIDMMRSNTTGTVNLTNPGTISHNEILQMYRDIVDPSFTWVNFTIEEQDAILKSKRSNNELDTTKLQSMYPHVKDIKTSVRECIVKMGSNDQV